MAIIANLFIDQGTDFTVTVDVSDATGGVLDLTGYSAAAQIRKTYGSSSTSAVFTTNLGTPSQGKVTLSLTDTQTSALDAVRSLCSGYQRPDLLRPGNTRARQPG